MRPRLHGWIMTRLQCRFHCHGTPLTSWSINAAVGGERLAESLRGVQAVRADDAPQLNWKAHSAAVPRTMITQPGVHVDNVFFVATPGMQSQITHASQPRRQRLCHPNRSTIIGLKMVLVSCRM